MVAYFVAQAKLRAGNGRGESTVAPKTKVQTILKIYAYNVTN